MASKGAWLVKGGVASGQGGAPQGEAGGVLRGRGLGKGAWLEKGGVASHRGVASKWAGPRHAGGKDWRGGRYLWVTLMTSRARGPAPWALLANSSAAAATSRGSWGARAAREKPWKAPSAVPSAAEPSPSRTPA